LGKSNFAKIVPKLSRCLLEDLSLLQCIRRHYMAINALPSKEAEPSCLCRRFGINIPRTRHNVTYNVLCRLVINWPVVELVTSVYFIYQHRLSRDWSVFVSRDRVTLNGMLHERIYTVWFCTHYQWIDVANLTKCLSETKYLCLLCQSDFHHRNLRIGTDCLEICVRGKTHLPSTVLWKYGKGAEKLGRSVRNIFLI